MNQRMLSRKVFPIHYTLYNYNNSFIINPKIKLNSESFLIHSYILAPAKPRSPNTTGPAQLMDSANQHANHASSYNSYS